MDNLTIKYYEHDHKTETEKLQPKGWISIQFGEPQKEHTVPNTDREAVLRAMMRITRGTKTTFRKGLHLWRPIDTVFTDHWGMGEISNLFFPSGNDPIFPLVNLKDFPHGWAVLHVVNGHYKLDKASQHHLTESRQQESVEEWSLKLDYIDAFIDHKLFVYSTGIERYFDALLANMALPRNQQRTDTILRVETGKVLAAVKAEEKPVQDLPLDADPTAPAAEAEAETFVVRAINTLDGDKEVLVDLEKVPMFCFTVIYKGYENTKVVTWKNTLKPLTKSMFRHFRDENYQLKGMLNKEDVLS